MDICQHCDMYMKPFFATKEGVVKCEFCSEVTRCVVNHKWEKVEPLNATRSTTESAVNVK